MIRVKVENLQLTEDLEHEQVLRHNRCFQLPRVWKLAIETKARLRVFYSSSHLRPCESL